MHIFLEWLYSLYSNEIKMRFTDFECSPERLSTKACGAPLDSHLPASSRTLGILAKSSCTSYKGLCTS